MKKKTTILLFTIVSALFLFGCTKLPASEETGVGPEEYTEIKKAEKVMAENENLIKERDTLKTEIQKMEKEYLDLAKNNDTVISKLEEAESKLDILENDGIPKFNSEKTDKNSIVTYLNNSKNVLNKSLRGIDSIDSSDENNVLFYTTGYGDSFNQIFIWNIGESEPVLIDGATFQKDGSVEWINDKLLLINTANQGEYKVLDIENKSILNTFYSTIEVYLIPNTATFIVQRQDSNTFVLYDFINSKEQEIDLESKNKYSSFEIDETKNIITFNGVYTDEYETSYTVAALLNLDKMKQQYKIDTLENVIQIKENNTETIESEGTE